MARAMKDSGIEWIGEIPVGWEVRKVKHYYEMQTGFTPDTKKEQFYDDENGYDWVNISDIQDGKTIFTTKKKVSQLFIDQYTPTIIPEGSLLYSFKLSVGQTAFTGKDMYSNEAIAAFLPVNEANLRFLRYSSSLIIENAEVNIYNARILNRDRINNAYIVFPPKAEQSRIADFLDAECARIDAVIEQTRASIEEYKKLKQSVITLAVTKGIRPGRRMVNSGVDWLGQIPDEWAVFRITNLYDERNERGTDDLPILTVSINTGISDHEIPDEEKDRVVARSEDRTLYKRVCPGDLAYNMMRAWQGAFGAARVDGMVSPAYVVAKPKMPGILDSRYVEALLRTPSAIEEMHRYSRGITDFRLRLYWPEFKNICVCVPSVKEQIEIADYIDAKAAEIDTLIQKKQQFLDEMESYKKSLIFEYVTGKKEVYN